MTRQRGFTLLELMVVLVIVAILAALAVSSYQFAIRKSRRAEAANYVGQLQLSLERWRAENPSYANSSPASASYPIASTASSYYTILISGQTALTYSVTATPKGTQATDTCGVLTATGNAKPTWATASCN
jgi:type IV pilus assembly protein PilE